MAIVSFKYKGQKLFYTTSSKKTILANYVKNLRVILRVLASNTTSKILKAPALKIYSLKVEFAGYYFYGINGN